jgi:PAS domain S-box-containing protein
MASSHVSGVRKLNALLQQAGEPIFGLDGRRRLFFVNRAWEELTGLAAESVLGRECPPPGADPDGDLAAALSPFYPPAEASRGHAVGGPTLIVHASGERRWRRVEYWPMKDERGRVLGLIGLVLERDAISQAPDSESRRLRAELEEIRERLRERYGCEALIGAGPAHRRLLDQLAAAAATRVPVLIVGEPGTGRRLAARTIHQIGPRSQSPLIVFDCAALPPEVLERELFRGPPGAGAAQEAARLALPDATTLLLFDVEALARDLQMRLVKALDGSFRLIATGATDPEVARREDRLRPDLYYALSTLVVRLSPLRERLDELPILAQHLLERINERAARRLVGFDPAALEVLAAYDWPGNIRELARVIEAAHLVAAEDVIAPGDLPATIRGHLGSAYTPPTLPSTVLPLDQMLTQVERRLIEQALVAARRNKSRAAEILDISRPRLYRRMKELNIPDESGPEDEVE